MAEALRPFVWKNWSGDIMKSIDPLIYGHCGCVLDHFLFIFGGATFAEKRGFEKSQYLNSNLYQYTIKRDGGFEYRGIYSGECSPPPRIGHSCCAVSDTAFMVFGGIGQSSKLNDLWLFDTVENKWKEIKATGSIPSPRGEHAMCLHISKLGQRRVYVFGGSTGSGSVRNDSNQLFSLDLDTMTWFEELTPYALHIPPGRSGHVMIEISGCLYVTGGISNRKQFCDLFEYNLETKLWTQMNPPPKALWFHAGCKSEKIVVRRAGAVFLPHPQLVLFGGQQRTDVILSEDCFSNDLITCDLSHNKGIWKVHRPPGDLPPGRKQCAFIYDEQRSRIILFGGNASQSRPGIYTLVISRPMYHLLEISPKQAIMAGGTEVLITGENFSAVEEIFIHFLKGSAKSECQGRFVDSHHIRCITPDLRNLGCGELEIEVSIGDYRAPEKLIFETYANTDPNRCIVFGMFLYQQDLRVAKEHTAVVYSIDESGRYRDSGGDKFIVKFFETSAESPGQTVLVDNRNGQYTLNFTSNRCGMHSLELFLVDRDGKQHSLRNSPYKLEVSESGWYGPPTEEDDKMVLDRVIGELTLLFEDIKRKYELLSTVSRISNLNNLIETYMAIHKVRENADLIRYSLDFILVNIKYLMKCKGIDTTKEWEAEIMSYHEMYRETDEKFELSFSLCADAQVVIESLTKSFSGVAKSELIEFEKRFQREAARLSPKSDNPSPIWLRSTSVPSAQKKIDKELSLLRGFLEEYTKLEFVAKVFDTRRFLIPKGTIEFEFNRIQSLEGLWAAKVSSEELYSSLQEVKWCDFSISLVEEIILVLSVVRTTRQYSEQSDIFNYLEKQLLLMENYLDIFASLTNKAFDSESWDLLLQRLEAPSIINPFTSPNVTLIKIIDLDLISHRQAVADIYKRAVCQVLVIEMITKHEEHWKTIHFVSEKIGELHEEGAAPHILIHLSEDDVDVIKNSLLTVLGLSSSSEATGLSEQLGIVIHNHKAVIELNETVSTVEEMWRFLDSAFSNSRELVERLSEYYSIFEDKTEEFFTVLQLIVEKVSLTDIVRDLPLLDRLHSCLTTFETIHKSIFRYLDELKTHFPRFYLLSDNDLLDLVSSYKVDIRSTLEKYGAKLYPFISSFIIEDDKPPLRVVGFITNRGNEQYRFFLPVVFKGTDSLINDLNNTLFFFVQKCALVAKLSYQMKEGRSRWINQKSERVDPETSPIPAYLIPEQLAHIVIRAYVASEINNSLKKKSLVQFKGEMLVLLSSVTSKLSEPTMIPNDRRRIENLSMQYLIQRDTVAFLDQAGVTDKNQFDWLRQFRFSIHDSGKKSSDTVAANSITKTTIFVDVLETSIPYGNEFLGEQSLIFESPQMSDCLFYIYYAIRHFKGIFILSEDNCGKTTLINRLSFYLGKLFRTINCTPTLNCRLLDSFLEGISGAQVHGFLENMHKLSDTLLRYFSSRVTFFMVKQKEIYLSDSKQTMQQHFLEPMIIGSFSTESIRSGPVLTRIQGMSSTFRPLTRIEPHRQKLVYSSLVCFGFPPQVAEEISLHLDDIFISCKKQFSSLFYDINHRTVNEILLFLRGKRTGDIIGELQAGVTEIIGNRLNCAEQELLKGILKSFFPKPVLSLGQNLQFQFGTSSVPSSARIGPGSVANSITGSGALPPVQTPRASHMVNTTCERVIFSNILEKDNLWSRKVEAKVPNYYVEQCYSFFTSIQNHKSIFLVGEANTGKSTIWNTVSQANRISSCTIIHPNIYSSLDLIGSVHPTTERLIPGVLTKLLKEISATTGEQKWIILDGEMDSTWSDFLLPLFDHTVPMLLPDGDLIFLNEIRVLVETSSLLHVTPASIVKSCVQYFPIKNQWLAIITGWIFYRLRANEKMESDGSGGKESQNDQACFALEQTFLTHTFLAAVQNMIAFLRARFQHASFNECTITLQAIDLFQLFHLSAKRYLASCNKLQIPLLYELISLFSISWSFGTIVKMTGNFLDMQILDKELRVLISTIFIHIKSSTFDRHRYVTDYFFDTENMVSVLPMEKTPLAFSVRPVYSKPVSSFLFIPTLSVIAAATYAQFMVSNERSVLLLGPSRSLRSHILNLLRNRYSGPAMNIHCSPSMTVDDFSPLVRSLYSQKCSFCFVDDINISQSDVSAGGIPAIIRRVLKEKTFDNSLHEPISFDHISFACTYNVNYCPVSSRCLSPFYIFPLAETSEGDICSTFDTVVKYYYQSSLPKDTLPFVLTETVNLLSSLSKLLPHSQANPHYIYGTIPFLQILESVVIKPFEMSKDEFLTMWFFHISRILLDRIESDADYSFVRERLQEVAKRMPGINNESRFLRLGSDEWNIYQVRPSAEVEQAIMDRYQTYTLNHAILNFHYYNGLGEQIIPILRLLETGFPVNVIVHPVLAVAQSFLSFSVFCSGYSHTDLSAQTFLTNMEFKEELKRLFLKAFKNEKVVMSLNLELIQDQLILETIYQVMCLKDLVFVLSPCELRTLASGMLQLPSVGVFESIASMIYRNFTLFISTRSIGYYFKRMQSFPRIFDHTTFNVIRNQASMAYESIISGAIHADDFLEKTHLEDHLVQSSVMTLHNGYLAALKVCKEMNAHEGIEYDISDDRLIDCIKYFKTLFLGRVEKTAHFLRFQKMGSVILETASNYLREDSENLRSLTNKSDETQLKYNAVVREKHELSSSYNDEKRELKQYRDAIDETTKEIADLQNRVKEKLDRLESEFSVQSSKVTDKYLFEITNESSPNPVFSMILSLFVDLFYDVFYRKDELSQIRDRRGKYQLDSEGCLVLRETPYTWNECLDLLLCKEHNIRSFKLVLEREFRTKIESGDIPEGNIIRSREKYRAVVKTFKPNQISSHNPCLAILLEWYKLALDLYIRLNEAAPMKSAIISRKEKLDVIQVQYENFMASRGDINTRIEDTEQLEKTYKSMLVSINDEISRLTSSLDQNKYFIDLIMSVQSVYDDKVNKTRKIEFYLYNSLFLSIYLVLGSIFPPDYRALFSSKLEEYFQSQSFLTPDSDLKTFHFDKTTLFQLQRDNLPMIPDYLEPINCFIQEFPSCYVYDPQLLFVGWFKVHYGSNAYRKEAYLDVVKSLEHFVTQDILLFVTDVPVVLDDSIMSLLLFIHKKRHDQLKSWETFGTSGVIIHPNFRLVLVNTRSSRMIPSSIFSVCPLVNFSVSVNMITSYLHELIYYHQEHISACSQHTDLMEFHRCSLRLRSISDSLFDLCKGIFNSQKSAPVDGEKWSCDPAVVESLRNAVEDYKSTYAAMNESNRRISKYAETMEKYQSISTMIGRYVFDILKIQQINPFYEVSLNIVLWLLKEELDEAGRQAGIKYMVRIVRLLHTRQSGGIHNYTSWENSYGFSVISRIQAQQYHESSNTEKLLKSSRDDRISHISNNAISGFTKHILYSVKPKEQLGLACYLFLKKMSYQNSATTPIISLFQDYEIMDLQNSFLISTSLNVFWPDSGQPHSFSQREYPTNKIEWMSDMTWCGLITGIDRKIFQEGILEEISSDVFWRDYILNESIEQLSPPSSVYVLLDSKAVCPGFFELICVRYLRPDRFQQAMECFLKKNQAYDFIEPHIVQIKHSYPNRLSQPADSLLTSQPPIPLVIYSEDGSINVRQLESLYSESKPPTAFGAVTRGSMLDLAPDKAITMLKDSLLSGGWVILYHCMDNPQIFQLITGFLIELSARANEYFKIILLVESMNIPAEFAKISSKIAICSDYSLTTDTFYTWTSIYDKTQYKAAEKQNIARVLYSLTFFHCVLKSRKRFGYFGWRQENDFINGTTLQFVSECLIENTVSSLGLIKWNILEALTKDLLYGCLVNDLIDFENLDFFSSRFFSKSFYELGGECNEFVPSNFVPDAITDYLLSLETRTNELLHISTFERLMVDIMSSETLSSTFYSLDFPPVKIVPSTSTTMSALLIMIEKLEPILINRSIKIPSRNYFFTLLLGEEVTRYERLRETILKHAKQLQEESQGQLSLAMRNLMDCLEQGRVPGTKPSDLIDWVSISWEPYLPFGSWLKDFDYRFERIRQWASNPPLPSSIYLPALNNPFRLFTCIRAQATSVDASSTAPLAMDFSLTIFSSSQFVTELPRTGVFVDGLTLLGAKLITRERSLSQMVLADSSSSSFVLPVIWVSAVKRTDQWIRSNSGDRKKGDSIYSCPVFKSSLRKRSEFEFFLPLPIQEGENSALWQIRNIAVVENVEE